MKTQLVDRLNDARTTLLSAFKSINPESGVSAAWTTKEVLAHIASWDDVSAEAIRILAAGGEPRVTVPQGIDAFNNEMAQAWSGKCDDQALHDFINSRKKFIAAIEDLPDHLVTAKFTLPWGSKGTLQDIVDILAPHEEEHAKELDQLNAKT